MSLQVEKLEKNMAKLTIEVSAEELEKALESAYQKNKNKMSIPGFRKGKVPRKMLQTPDFPAKPFRIGFVMGGGKQQPFR